MTNQLQERLNSNKAFEDVPRQEIFLEIAHKNEETVKVYLDEIAEMDLPTLRGFRQYVIGKILALNVDMETFWGISKEKNEENIDRKSPSFSNFKKLSFKRKIYVLFGREIDFEYELRRKQELQSQSGLEKWMQSVGLDTDVNSLSAKLKIAREFSAKLSHLLSLCREKLSSEVFNELAEKAKLTGIETQAEAYDNYFLAYVSMKRKKPMLKSGLLYPKGDRYWGWSKK